MNSADPEIIFEDNHLIVLNKPAGLLSQGESSRSPNVVDFLRGYLGRPYVGLIHRLDRNTSGLMIIAKRTKAARRLTAALADGRLVRNYQAWVWGRIPQACRWEHWITKDRRQNEVRPCGSSDPGARRALMHVEPKAAGFWQGRPVTKILCRLETGRSHQIRIQSAVSGHPLVGDFKYGLYAREPWNREFGRPALHSSSLSFPHPVSEKLLRFTAPLPEDMQRLGRGKP